ncbi:MAG: complex I NDUFA9 subunit family protein [Usitatibacter sp.]
MKIRNTCIVGGSGFVGAAVAAQLAGRGIKVRVLTRRRPPAMALAVLPTVELMVTNPHHTATLARAFEGMDAVVNLVGILHETGRQSFRGCHVELPTRVAEACRSAGVRHLVHMSALGASESGPSEYLRTKAQGEAAVKDDAGILPVTIFRPSVMFGEDDRFLNMFATLLRLFPLIPLGGAHARFQPVWVNDVARCISECLGESRHFGKVYSLCGPKAYTLEELVRFVGATIGKPRRVWALPGALASLQAFALEHLPGKLMTRDNLRSMSLDNTCPGPFPAVFGFQPSALEAIVPAYLAATLARARYARYRQNAGR